MRDEKGEPWFVANDVARILGLANMNVTIRSKYIAPDERGKKFLGGAHSVEVNIISESGLYKLIMRSNKPEARRFQDWVTAVVLPSIEPNPELPTPQQLLQSIADSGWSVTFVTKRNAATR